MDRLAKLLEALLAEETLPDNWNDQVTEAYEYDLSIPNSKIAELEAIIAEKDAEITRLKVHNYELLMNTDEVEDELEDVVDDEDDITTDDLFGDPEEDD